MCPGGEVIAAASQPGGVAVNGMSYHARAGENANAAVLVGVRPEDFGDDHPLAGFVLQRSVEQAAYRLGGGGFKAPAQRLEDFLAGRASTGFGGVRAFLPARGYTGQPVGMPGRVLSGGPEAGHCADGTGSCGVLRWPDAVLTGVETRSSSPVRLSRDALRMGNLAGLYPVGEGAGYAGGIVSAAVDGIDSALAALERSTL